MKELEGPLARTAGPSPRAVLARSKSDNVDIEVRERGCAEFENDLHRTLPTTPVDHAPRPFFFFFSRVFVMNDFLGKIVN